MNLDDASVALRELARGGGGSVTWAQSGSLVRIRIDHSPRRNALSLRMMADLASVVQRLRATEDASVVLVDAVDPRVFCAGGDLTELPDAPADAVAAMSAAMAATLDALLDLPMLVVAAVDGLALGGGAELLTAFDLCLAGPNARVQFVQAQLGIAPGWGGAGRLVERIGRHRALQVLIGAQRYERAEALAMGLFDVALDGDPIDTAALTWLAPMLARPVGAARAIKQQVVAARPARRASADTHLK